MYSTRCRLLLVDVFGELPKERCGESPVRGLIKEDITGGLTELLTCYLTGEQGRGGEGEGRYGFSISNVIHRKSILFY